MRRRNEGCEIVGTAVMTCEESALFLKVAIKNGLDTDEALADMKMMDAIFHMHRLQLVCAPLTNKTASGRFRKDSTFQANLEKIIDARMIGAFKYDHD